MQSLAVQNQTFTKAVQYFQHKPQNSPHNVFLGSQTHLTNQPGLLVLSTSLGKKHATRSDHQLDSFEDNLRTWST